jgi:acyl dehydratase
MSRRTFTLAGLREAAGQELGMSDWYPLDQRTLDSFAATTGDRETIHLDPAAARSYGLDGTIAHGLLTLSLGPMFLQDLYEVTDYSRVLNYGFDKVRFLAPVPVDSSIRMTARVSRTRAVEGGIAVHITQTFDLRHPDGTVAERPACVAEAVLAYFD